MRRLRARDEPSPVLRGATRRIARAVVLACATAVDCPATQAAHPLASEDPGTQGAGNAELESGFAAARGGAGGSAAELAPQFSFGLAPTVDVILRPTWLDLRPAGDDR